ncbi:MULTISPECIES: hypothetical protein [unclassified Rudaea]|uniref:hypothetical protein n=1 Tax=unclassified Rudaea TaxID=2627037 RepID=UPI002015EE84|nr:MULTISPECIES: hypothetical protein [unclassified Rudaea]
MRAEYAHAFDGRFAAGSAIIADIVASLECGKFVEQSPGEIGREEILDHDVAKRLRLGESRAKARGVARHIGIKNLVDHE